jgi:hypothetical protein
MPACQSKDDLIKILKPIVRLLGAAIDLAVGAGLNGTVAKIRESQKFLEDALREAEAGTNY